MNEIDEIYDITCEIQTLTQINEQLNKQIQINNKKLDALNKALKQKLPLPLVIIDKEVKE